MTMALTWQQFEQMDREAQATKLADLGEVMLAETAVFDQTADMLAYHNQLPALTHLLEAGWAHLQHSQPNEWRQQMITARLTDTLVFQQLANPTNDSAAALQERLRPYTAVDAAGLQRYLDHLNGYTQYQWQIDHLADHPPQNMAALLIEFLAYAHKEAGIPYGRSNLIRHLLPTYLVERRTGQLTPRQDFGDLMRSGRPLPKPPASFHPLVPDSDSLQRFLAKLLNYDPIRPYLAAALFTLLPTWLTFLQARQLLTASEATAALSDLASLQTDLLTFYRSFAEDEALETAVSHWPDPDRTDSPSSSS